METNQLMTRVNLDLLKEATEATYMDGDIIIFDGLKEFSIEGTLQMDMIVVILCVEGKLQVDINGQTHIVHTNELLVCPPNVYIDNYMFSPNFDSKIIGLSYSALQRMLHANKDIWNMVLRLVKNPIFKLDEHLQTLINHYYTLMLFKLSEEKGLYYNDVMQALFQAMFYDLCSIIASSLSSPSETGGNNMRQGDKLINRFLKLLADSQGRERSVTAFAERLYVTPKYLSTVCKTSTGKTALEWIHEYTTEVIIQRLKYSEKSIKEIADELNFPNISFFGKFVKARLGVSPATYKKQFAERNRNTTK